MLIAFETYYWHLKISSKSQSLRNKSLDTKYNAITNDISREILIKKKKSVHMHISKLINFTLAVI